MQDETKALLTGKTGLAQGSRNVELARAHGTTGHLGGWEHITMRQAARTIEAQAAEIERLRRAWEATHAEKVKEKEEAKLWFEKAQEWKSDKIERDTLRTQLADALGLLGAARHVMAPDISLRGEIKAFIDKHRATAMDDLIAGDADMIDKP